MSTLRIFFSCLLTAAIMSAALSPDPSALASSSGAISAGAPPSCPAPEPGVISCLARFRPAGAPFGPLVHDAAQASEVATSTPSGYSPADVVSAYQLTSAQADAGTPTVAVVQAYDDPGAAAKLATYRSTFDLGTCAVVDGCFREVGQDGGAGLPTASQPDWAADTDAALDMVSAVCPSCRILLVETDTPSDLWTGVATATRLGARVVSMSWSTTDWPGAPAWTSTYFARRNVAYVAAAGDTGYRATYPASSPDVVAVGGTRLIRDPATPRGWRETVWNDTAGATSSGCSAYSPRPAWQAAVVSASVCEGRVTADLAVVADPATGVAAYTDDGWVVAGGTSVSAPIVAAMYGLAGPPNYYNHPSAYPYYHREQFYDVTRGHDSATDSACTAAVLCAARAGYDGPSGVGSPDGVAGLRAVPPPTDLRLAKTGPVHTWVGAPVTLAVHASCSDTLARFAYRAAGLPPGVALTRLGTITGRPLRAGAWTVTVTATSSGGPRVSDTFTWTTSRHHIVAGATPTVLGTPALGATLSVSPVRWHRDTVRGLLIHPALRYQWFLAGRPVPGATAATFTVPTRRGVRGQRVTVRLSADKPYYVPLALTTAPTKEIA